nr:hypothetical protein Iba_chr10dCG12920 [Ipomoea batatas]
MDMGVQILEIEIGVGIRGGRRQRRGNLKNGGVHCVVVLDCDHGGGSKFRHYLTTVRDVQYCIREAFNATEVGGGKRVNEANNRLSKMGEQNVKCLICPHISQL